MKFCGDENFNEKFHEFLKKILVRRINHKRYKLKYMKCLLNIMSI